MNDNNSNNKKTPSSEATRSLASDLNPTELSSGQSAAQVAGSKVDIASAENAAHLRPTPENFLDLSLAYHQAGRYQECIAASRKALRTQPRYAEAHNNISASYQSMGQWDAAIASARDALRISPNYRLAKNNLAFALKMKQQSQ